MFPLDYLNQLEDEIKSLYLENMEKPSDIHDLDEMDIGWFFELSRFSAKNKKTSNSPKKERKEVPQRGYIDQIPGF